MRQKLRAAVDTTATATKQARSVVIACCPKSEVSAFGVGAAGMMGDGASAKWRVERKNEKERGKGAQIDG